MFKIITKTGCTKNNKLCSLYPTTLGFDKKAEKKEVTLIPDNWKVTEAKRPECWYCNRSTEKVKKDRYKA